MHSKITCAAFCPAVLSGAQTVELRWWSLEGGAQRVAPSASHRTPLIRVGHPWIATSNINLQSKVILLCWDSYFINMQQ